MSNHRIYRAGVIGTGRIASTIQDEVESGPFSFLLPYSHAGAYAAHPAVTLVAAADVNRERLDAFGQRWHVDALYDDFREMLSSADLDIVSVCTPTRFRGEVVAAIAASGGIKGVLLEKPVAITLREADDMTRQLADAGIKTVVNHVRTFDPYFRRIKRLIEHGAIGEPRSVLVRWHEGLSFGGSHLFDLLRFLLGSEPVSVTGSVDPTPGLFDPGGVGRIAFPGVEVLVDLRDNNAGPREIDIAGTGGRIRAGDRSFPELYTVDASSGELVQRVFPGSVDGTSPMVVAVGELIAAIESGTKPASDITDGRKNLEIAVAFHVSSRGGGPAPLPVADLDVAVDDPWGRA